MSVHQFHIRSLHFYLQQVQQHGSQLVHTGTTTWLIRNGARLTIASPERHQHHTGENIFHFSLGRRGKFKDKDTKILTSDIAKLLKRG